MKNKTNPLADNPHVQELFCILKENDKDTAGLTALLSHVKKMENFIKSAERQIKDMKTQVEEIKEIQKSPVKTALNNTSNALERNVTNIRGQLNKIRSSIIDGCKNAIKAVKENGVVALDKLAEFFHVKQGFEAIRKDTNAGIEHCDKSITKIETFSREYHATGRHMKNLLRMTVGKEPIDTPKEIGKMAKTMCSPYKNEKKPLESIGSVASKAISKLEELGKNADKIKQECTSDKKSPTAERLAKVEEKAKQTRIEKPPNVIDIKTKVKASEVVL